MHHFHLQLLSINRSANFLDPRWTFGQLGFKFWDHCYSWSSAQMWHYRHLIYNEFSVLELVFGQLWIWLIFGLSRVKWAKKRRVNGTHTRSSVNFAKDWLGPFLSLQCVLWSGLIWSHICWSEMVSSCLVWCSLVWKGYLSMTLITWTQSTTLCCERGNFVMVPKNQWSTNQRT